MNSHRLADTSSIAPVTMLHLIQGLETGGLESMVVNLVKQLDPMRFQPRICCFDVLGEMTETLTESRIPVILLQRSPGIDLRYPLKLAGYLKKHRIRILHLHNPTALFYGTLAGKIARTPTIIYTEHGRDLSLSRKVNLTNRILSTQVDRIVAVANKSRRYLLDREKMNQRKVVTIFNGIDEKIFASKASGESVRAGLGLAPERPLAGIVARLDPIKNHTCLIRAMKLVIRSIPEAVLLVMGDGPIKQQLVRLTAKLELQDTVRFLGNRADIPELLDLMDVYTLPSFSEGLSLTLIEACASGTPIVATDVGGNSEIVIHNRNGLLVPSDNPQALAKALIRIFSNKKEAETMGAEGRKIFQAHFTLKQMVRAYEALYKDTLQPGAYNTTTTRKQK